MKKIFSLLILAVFISCKEDPLPDVLAEFSANKNKVLIGESVTYTDKSIGDPVTWEWSFEGGTPTTSTDQNPTVSYNQAGIYSVSLLAKNDQNTGSILKEQLITVFNEVSASFDVDKTIVYEGDVVGFTDTSSGSPTNWQWTFNGGYPVNSDIQNPMIVYNEPGIYDVTLLVSNELSSEQITVESTITVLPKEGLIASYLFEGDATDDSGNSLDGVVYGASLTTDKNGIANQAYYFDGIDDRIEVENNSLLEPENYSISAWIKLDSDETTGAIVSLSSFGGYVDNNCGYYFSYVDNLLRGFYSIGKPNWAKSISAELVPVNDWVHVVTTFDGQNLLTFMNGVEVSRTSTTISLNYIEHNPLNIGAYSSNTSSGNWHKGAIDNIRIYNRSLNLSSIEALSKEM